MEIDELLIAIGVDTSQAAKIKDVIVEVGKADIAIAKEANAINKTLDNVGKESIKSNVLAAESAEQVKSGLTGLKVAALGVGAVMGLVTAKVMGFVGSYISGARDMAESKDALFKISEEELAQADEYQESMGKNGRILDSIKTKIALNLAPALTRTVGIFNDWIVANKKLIVDGLTKVVEWTGRFVQIIVNAARAVIALIDNTIGFKGAIMLLAGAFLYLNRAMLTNPITWIVVALVGLLLLIDDLMVYLDGGESAFGDFWGACISWLKKVKSWWDNLSGDMQKGIKLIGSLLAIAFGTNVFLSLAKGAFSFGGALKWLLLPLASLIKYVAVATKTFLVFGRVLLANPIGIVIALVAGLAYALFDLYKWLKTGESAFGGFWQSCAEMWEKIKAKTKDALMVVLTYFGIAVSSAESFIASLGSIFSVIFKLITTPFKLAFRFLKGVFDIFSDDSTSWMDKLAAIFDLAVEYISAPFKMGWEIVKSLFNDAGNYVSRFISVVGDKFKAVTELITRPFETATKYVGGMLDGIGRKLGIISGDAGMLALNSRVANQLQAVSSLSANSAAVGAQTNNRTLTINQGGATVNQSIHTSNPVVAANLANGGISRELRRANGNLRGAIAG